MKPKMTLLEVKQKSDLKNMIPLNIPKKSKQILQNFNKSDDYFWREIEASSAKNFNSNSAIYSNENNLLFEEKQIKLGENKIIPIINYSEIKLLDVIGEGTFGIVHKAIIKDFVFALKNDSISIALEFMDIGSLNDILKLIGKIPEVILGFITFQILQGLEYLHKQKKIIHRDIKPSNLLVNSNGSVKIGKLLHTNDEKNTWVGTIKYMSPERIKDLWSLGVTILECAIGRYPFPQENNINLGFWELLDYISKKPTPKLNESVFSQEMQSFIEICLQKKCGSRSNASDLLKHPFVEKYKNVNKTNFKNWLSILKNDNK